MTYRSWRPLHSSLGWAQATLLAAVVLLMGLSVASQVVNPATYSSVKHPTHFDSSMTILTTQSSNPYTQAYGTGYNTGNGYLYSNQGPSGKTWVVNVQIGLKGGDNVQQVDFIYQMMDCSSSAGGTIVGLFSDSKVNWVVQGGSEIGTMTASLTNNLCIWWFIDNDDSASQTFTISATAAYF